MHKSGVQKLSKAVFCTPERKFDFLKVTVCHSGAAECKKSLCFIFALRKENSIF
ncbi:Uncharacterized protein dnm_073500 [Desulfonema magnum]|uniref:Uncharacterized protein n=1 Tax=Desulfonema magnum TaxID=45655 RepID=A0A975GRP9_9BACT|nr:Uncharacterized protein dnm_073500 [Desulfonema magnum]